MTTFTGPVHIRRLDSDTTAIRLDAGGSATFTDTVRASAGIQVGTAVTVDGTLNVSGASTFVGKVTAAGGLQVGAATTVDGALNVSGASTFVGKVTAAAGIQIGAACTVDGGLNVSGASLFVGAVSAKTDVVVSGRVRSGAAQGIGDIVLSQSATIAGNATAATTVAHIIPAGSQIHDVMMTNIIGIGTAGSTINFLVGTSGKDDRFGSFANVSARSASLLSNGTVSGRSLAAGVTADMKVLVKATVASGAFPSAASSGSKLFTVSYARKA